MPTPTYTPLANITLGSSAASVTFSSISQAYRDLIYVFAGKDTNYTNQMMRFNSDSGSNYSSVRMFGNGSSASSNTVAVAYNYIGGMSNTDNGIITVQIMDYSVTDKHKTALAVQDIATDNTMRLATRWASTSAISSIVVSPTSGSFAAGSTFALYGVAA